MFFVIINYVQLLKAISLLKCFKLLNSLSIICLLDLKVSPYSDELKSLVANVVDGISFNIMRLHGFGMNNFVVANLPNMPCSPFITAQSNFSACSDNSTIIAENSIHNELLIKRMDLLKNQLGVRILILDQTKAFDHVFHNGGDFGKLLRYHFIFFIFQK